MEIWKSVQDKYLINEALEEGRILLTGDKLMYEIIMEKAQKQNKHLYYKENEIPQAVKIKQDKPENQLKQLYDIIPLDYILDFNEMCCSECGGHNSKVNDKNEIQDLISECVFNSVDEFWKCQQCSKIFWIGNQTKNIIKTYEKIMDLINKK